VDDQTGNVPRVPRRLHRILFPTPLLIAAAFWAWSFRHVVGFGNGRWAVMSKLGAVYVLIGHVDDGYSDTPAGSNWCRRRSRARAAVAAGPNVVVQRRTVRYE
jgi:hypothetical protein